MDGSKNTKMANFMVGWITLTTFLPLVIHNTGWAILPKLYGQVLQKLDAQHLQANHIQMVMTGMPLGLHAITHLVICREVQPIFPVNRHPSVKVVKILTNQGFAAQLKNIKINNTHHDECIMLHWKQAMPFLSTVSKSVIPLQYSHIKHRNC